MNWTGRKTWTARGSTPEIDVRSGRFSTVRRASGPAGELVAVRVGPREWAAAEVAGLRARPGLIEVLDEGEGWFVVPWYELNLRDWAQGAPPLEALFRALKLAAEAAELVPEHGLWKPETFLVDEQDDLRLVLGDLGAANPTWTGDVPPGAFAATVTEVLGTEAKLRDRLTGRVADPKGLARQLLEDVAPLDAASFERARERLQAALIAALPSSQSRPAARAPAIDPTQSAVFVLRKPEPAPPPPPPAPPPPTNYVRIVIVVGAIGAIALVGVVTLTALGIWVLSG